MLLVIALVSPFFLFISGAYIFDYPAPLGVLYGLNVALIYVVLWFVANQAIKVHSQKMSILGNNLYLSRKQIFFSTPVVRRLELEVPLDSVRAVSLVPTKVGYQMTVRFDQGDKTLGVDLDLNPLKTENRDVLARLLAAVPGLNCDETTGKCLEEYEKKIFSWKGSYVFSLLLIGFALVIFLFVSIYMGMSR